MVINMNIDKLEKINEFPGFIKYAKESLYDNLEYFIIFILLFFFGILSLASTFSLFIILSIYGFNINKKIFNAFQERKRKLSNI